jgi:mRNA interferase MazF
MAGSFRVINATRLFTIDKSDLTEKIGRLSSARVREILDGLRLVTEPGEM